MSVFWKISLVVTLALCSQVFAENKKGGLMGGWRDLDANDKNVPSILEFAKDEYNKYSNDGYITEMSKTIRIQRQVVAGMKYAIDVEAVFCPENKSYTEECQNQTTKKRCSFEVLIVPWRGLKELRKSNCNNI